MKAILEGETMKQKQPKKANSGLWLEDSHKATLRMQAIQTASNRPGKSAEKVVADAEKIMAFVLQ